MHILFTPHRPIVPTVYPVKMGLLYNYWAATDLRKITSSDIYSVPSISNFNTLATYLGGNTIAGGKLKEIGYSYFDTPNTGATNEVKFNGRGAGVRQQDGTFPISIRKYTYFIVSGYTYGGRYLVYNNATFGLSSIGYENKWGFSLRLFRPATAPEQLLADGTACDNYVQNDGKLIPTVKIGTQIWTAANSVETKFRNGDYIHGYEGGVYTPISNADWAALTTAGVCCYLDNLDNI